MNLVKINTKSIMVVTMIILLASLLSGTISSFAIQDDPAGVQTEVTISAAEEARNPFAFRSSDIVGSSVQNLQGEQLGNIDNLIVDTESGQILFAVLSCCGFLGFGTDLFAVPWESLTPKPALGIFTLDVELQRLRETPTFSPDNWPAIGDRQWGAGIMEYYGYSFPTYPGGGFGYWPYSQRQVGGWGMDTPYGMMFNPETVETFEAAVIRVDRFVPMTGMDEGIELIINLDGDPTPVHLGPSWYLQYQDYDIQEGAMVEITGSRINLQGLPVVIATRIVSMEGTLNLRNELGYTLWSPIPPMETVLIEGEEAVVNIYEHLFFPGAIEIAPGTTITWINRDSAPHTVTSGVTGDDKTGEVFDSPELQIGQEFSYTFNEPGIYPYFCRFHPNMTGRVTVLE
jgi:plastocyanin/sporulation protein YlmC with PRC-barrel domain